MKLTNEMTAISTYCNQSSEYKDALHVWIAVIAFVSFQTVLFPFFFPPALRQPYIFFFIW